MKLMLIGGGEIGRGTKPYETKEIDEEIVKMTNKEKPKLLFIGLANSYADSYYDYIKNIYKNLGCETMYLKKKNVTKNPDIVKNKIEEADIIYIGGGDTIKLMNTVKEYKIDELLKKAKERNCVLAGISAGAILLSKSGFSDSYILREESDKHEFVEGLNFIDINICPHFHNDEKKQKDLEDNLKNNNKEVYGLENCTALKIEDNKMIVIKSKKDSNVYLCKYEKKYIENVI